MRRVRRTFSLWNHRRAHFLFAVKTTQISVAVQRRRILNFILRDSFEKPQKTWTIYDMKTNLSRLWSASLNLFPRSFSPLAITQSWLRKCFARDAWKGKKSANQHWLLRRGETDLIREVCETDQSALCRPQGSLLSLTRWTAAGKDARPCWDLAPCYGSSAGTQSCV